MLGAGGLLDAQVWIFLEHVQGLDFSPVHGVDFAGRQRVGAGHLVEHDENFAAIEMAALVALVEVRETLQIEAHAGLEARDRVTAGADALLPHRHTVLRRQDRDVVVAGDVREVRVAFPQFEHHGVLAVGLHFGDRRDDILHRRRGVLREVVIVRGDDVVGVHGLAVVEFDVLAQLECPLRGVVGGRPAGGKLAHQLARGVDLGQEVARRESHPLGEVLAVQPGVHVVGARSRADADTKMTALLGRRRDGLAGHRRSKPDGDAQGRRAAHEFAPRDLAVLEKFGVEIEFFHDVPPIRTYRIEVRTVLRSVRAPVPIRGHRCHAPRVEPPSRSSGSHFAALVFQMLLTSTLAAVACACQVSVLGDHESLSGGTSGASQMAQNSPPGCLILGMSSRTSVALVPARRAASGRRQFRTSPSIPELP